MVDNIPNLGLNMILIHKKKLTASKTNKIVDYNTNGTTFFEN